MLFSCSNVGISNILLAIYINVYIISSSWSFNCTTQNNKPVWLTASKIYKYHSVDNDIYLLTCEPLTREMAKYI